MPEQPPRLKLVPMHLHFYQHPAQTDQCQNDIPAFPRAGTHDGGGESKGDVFVQEEESLRGLS